MIEKKDVEALLRMAQGGLKYYDMDGKPITLMEWDDMLAQPRHIGDDRIGNYRISTCWMGLDMRFPGYNTAPLIFETMIFSDDEDCELNGWMDRFSTKSQAEQGHKYACQMVRDHIAGLESKVND